MSNKYSKFGDSVALEMEKTLDNPAFKQIFAKPEVEKVEIPKIDPTYQAFVRIASTTDSSSCMAADDCSSSSSMAVADGSSSSSSKSKKPTDINDVMNIDDILGPSVNVLAKAKPAVKKPKDKTTESSSTEPKKKVKKAEVGLALQYITNSLIQTSAALDNLGLIKSSSITLGLLDSIVREASLIALGQEVLDQMADRVNEMSPEDILADSGKKMSNGYAYLLESGDDWKDSSDELWQNEIYEPKGNETYIGDRKIDGSDVAVFKTEDGKYYAQPPHMTDSNSAEAPEAPEAHKNIVTDELKNTQKDVPIKHDTPPTEMKPNKPYGRPNDFSKAEDGTTEAHTNKTTHTVTKTQKDVPTKHETPATEMKPNKPKYDSLSAEDLTKTTKTTNETNKKTTEKEPKQAPINPEYKDLYPALASLVTEIESWIKK